MASQPKAGSSRHRRTVHREAPVIDVSSRRAAEESAWRIKSVKLERDRHAQQRHLNPLNMADTIGHLVNSFKGRHRDAILVIGEDTLEVFVESPETAAPTKKIKKGLGKVFGRKDSDSDNDVESLDATSGVGDTEEALDGHLFSVGVAFAQILQLSQHDKAITIYYHPNSFSSTQSIRSNLANCWRFTVALETPEEADSVLSDIRLQLARYAQGIHWVHRNFLLDESISALLITTGPMALPSLASPADSNECHTVIQMDPDFNTPFPAPESWNQQAAKGEASDIVRVFLQTPTGSCHVDITRAILQNHLQGDRGHFYVTAVSKPKSNEICTEALEKRRSEISKYLVQNNKASHRLSLSHQGSFTSHQDDASVAATPVQNSLAPTPRAQSTTAPPNIFRDSPTPSEASVSNMAHDYSERSPRAGNAHGGFAFSDRPILGGTEDLARSKSFSGQGRGSNLSVVTGRTDADDDPTQAMRRVNSWSSLSGSPTKSKPAKALTIHADTDSLAQADTFSSDRDLSAPRRLGSVRFAAEHLQPDSPSGSSITGQVGSPRARMMASAAAVRIRLHCKAQRFHRRSSAPQSSSSAQPSTASQGPPPDSSTQLKPLTQLAAKQPHLLSDIISDPAIWIAYTPLTLVLLLLLLILKTAFWSSLFASAVSTSICVLYAAQQRLLLGRQQKIAVVRAHKAVTSAADSAFQRQSVDEEQDGKQLGSTQIMLTLLGAEITDSLSAEETGELSMYDDDSASEVELEAVPDGPAPSQAQVQARLEHASVAQSGPTTTEGQPCAVPLHQSVLRRFSKEHAVSEDIQKRFMIAVENDEKAAKKRVQEMLEWKNKNGLAECLRTPQPHYDTMKKAIFHGIICFSRTDHPVRIMKVGDMRAAWKKMKAAGINSDNGLRHFGFVEEYIWQVLDPRPLPLGTAIWIVDLGGMGLSDLGSEAFQFFKRMSVEVGMHYPERLYKLVLLNAPSFFSLLWRICEPIMPGSTRNKVKVVRSHQELITALADECDASQIPSDYGGSAPTPLYESKIELELRDFVHNLG